LHKLKRDIAGERFGKLVVLSFSHRNNYRVSMWNCICDCGNTKVGNGNSLQKGDTRSCGCMRKLLPKGEAALNQVIYRYKRRAKKRNIKYDLTREQFKELTQKNCFYCKSPPSNISKGKTFNGELKYSGIDRLDPTLGYEEGNVVPCCEICNFGKRSRTLEQFREWVARVYNHEKGSYHSPNSDSKWTTKIYNTYKYRARRKNLEFDLAPDIFQYLIEHTCYYCGVKPSSVYNFEKSDNQLIYNGLDRIDHTKGYTIPNVYPCCSDCNFAKKDLTEEEFLGWINKLYGTI